MRFQLDIPQFKNNDDNMEVVSLWFTTMEELEVWKEMYDTVATKLGDFGYKIVLEGWYD